MLPSPSPEISAEPIMNKNGRARRPLVSSWSWRLLVHPHRQDLIIDELRPDVVVLVQGVVVLGRKGLVVVLDQALVFGDLVVTIAHLLAVGRAGVLDGERAQHHG